MMDIVADALVRVAVTWQMLRQRLLDESGELSSQQVIWIATLATIAVTVGGIIAAKVTSAAQSIDLGGSG
jgi:hypothetical protein